MNYLHESLQWFNTLTIRRKTTFILGISSILMITALLCWWVISPTYAVLFNHLDNRDAHQIIGQLEQANIPYQVRNEGNDILINKNLIEKTRIKLMGSNLQLMGSVGFELFDKSDFGMTDFSQKINYQRALQGELERTITSLEEVKQARVHLVIPEHQLFEQNNNQPRASVTLHLNHALTSHQVRSIQQLITASVAHMKSEHVIIIDHNGNTLTTRHHDPASNHFSIKKSIEHYLNDKVMQMLTKVFKNTQVMVKIDATLNYDELQRELVKPQSDGMITHEKETRHVTNNKTENLKTNQDITREKSYQFGSEQEHFKRATGTIERLSISVIVPQQTDNLIIEQIQRLVKNVVGFNAKRGDEISVEALIHNPSHKKLPHPAITAPKKITIPFELISAALGAFTLTTSTVLLIKRKIRRKKRQLLLSELTQWLAQHD